MGKKVETTFIRPDHLKDDWVKGSRIPDLMVITAARLDAYKAATPDRSRWCQTFACRCVISSVDRNAMETSTRC